MDFQATLRSQLTQRKPPIICNVRDPENTPATPKWPKIESVEVWTSFNLHNLNSTYAYLLDPVSPSLPCPQANEYLNGVIINKPMHIKLLTSWNYALMSPTLDAVKGQFLHAHGYMLSHTYTDVDRAVSAASVSGTGRKVSVDHAIALDKSPKQNLVIGLGRASAKFNMTELPQDQGFFELAPSRMRVLKQLGHQCQTANTRYGYIQTDKELVACKFKRNPENNHLRVYAMPIPWSCHGPNVLTTDLGLWWLGMKALTPYGGPQIEYIGAPNTPLPVYYGH